jgi:peptidoglycan/LPS O-acetylase OafA/YrhL
MRHRTGTRRGGSPGRSEPLSYEEYRATRFFPALDGLRAFSVLAVILTHMHSHAWDGFSGGSGVFAFFVLSGFLITTLLSRQRRASGRVRLRAFFVRRAFRILPLYLVVLFVYVVLVIVLGQAPEKRPGLIYALPYFLTFTNEFPVYLSGFHGPIPFFTAWSLGVEEKFYLVWPVLGFLVLRGARARFIALLGGTIVLQALYAVSQPVWSRWYAAILVGCVLGIALDDERLHRVVARLAPRFSPLIPALALVCCHFALGRHSVAAAIAYPWIVAWLILGFVLLDSPTTRVAASTAAGRIGSRSYGMYLVQLFAIDAAVKVFAPSSTVLPRTIAGYLLAVALSFAAADVLHRVVEAPMITRGRRLAAKLQPERATAVAAAPVNPRFADGPLPSPLRRGRRG